MVKASKTSKKAPTKKIVKKQTTTSRKSTAKEKAVVSTKVDYYPNRMTVAVSALAGTLLVLFAIIAVLGSQ